MVVYIENPEASTIKLLEQINSARSTNEDKHKKIVFVYTVSEHMDREIKNTTPIMIAQKNKIGLNLAKYAQ